jgi:hypothetical protein
LHALLLFMMEASADDPSVHQPSANHHASSELAITDHRQSS